MIIIDWTIKSEKVAKLIVPDWWIKSAIYLSGLPANVAFSLSPYAIVDFSPPVRDNE